MTEVPSLQAPTNNPDHRPKARRLLHRGATVLMADPLLTTLLLLLPLLIWASELPLPSMVGLIHWHTLAILAALMLLSRGLESSGYLVWTGARLLRHVGSIRLLGVTLVLFAAGLAAVITNDVALFIVIPLTLGMAAGTSLPVGRLVILQALAVNAGSSLSPIGNPQNLYLWQTSSASFIEFTLVMLPLGGLLLLLVLAAVPLTLPAGGMHPAPHQPIRLQRGLLWLVLPCYPLLLLAAEAGWALPATALIMLASLLLRPALLRELDWGLLLIFLLMFLDLGLLANLPLVAGLSTWLETPPGGLYTMTVLLSQLMSNVPATIFLAEFSSDWQRLAYGAAVGGFGLAIGSLANLIALRLAPEPGLWLRFHFWSVPMLAASWVLGLGLLHLLD